MRQIKLVGLVILGEPGPRVAQIITGPQAGVSFP